MCWTDERKSTPSINTNIAVTPQVQETSGCDAARDVVAIDKPSPVDLEDRCDEIDSAKGSTPQRRSVPFSSSSATLQRKMRSSQPLINRSTKPKSGSKRKDNSTSAASPEVSDEGATQIIVLDDESSSADDCDDMDKSTGSSTLEKHTSPLRNVVGTLSKTLPRKRPSRAVVNHAAVGSKGSYTGSVEKPSSEAEVDATMEASGDGSDAVQGPSSDPPRNVEESTAEQEAASNETSRKQIGQASIQQGELVLKRDRRVMKRARVSLRSRR
ncbi:unnamed protein product [Heligmosomoides polygyrus]|uniref:Uncharacterized protein n=1 Tax=Heligmosomoides polygyrus TaxID=6339 RepID=A0A183F478_HELPZ|nr:unnamed protein product [Heligmosomoides polygyrus]